MVPSLSIFLSIESCFKNESTSFGYLLPLLSGGSPIDLSQCNDKLQSFLLFRIIPSWCVLWNMYPFCIVNLDIYWTFVLYIAFLSKWLLFWCSLSLLHKKGYHRRDFFSPSPPHCNSRAHIYIPRPPLYFDNAVNMRRWKLSHACDLDLCVCSHSPLTQCICDTKCLISLFDQHASEELRAPTSFKAGACFSADNTVFK